MVCGVELVPVANRDNGLLSVLDCSSMRSPLWWNAWMKNYSCGMSLAVSCNGFNSDVVSARLPYSWMFCRICCGISRLGVIVSYVSDMFAESYG